jgi:hypothetical protein
MRRPRLLITLTLDEGTLDMGSGDELNDDLHDVGGIGTASTRLLPASVNASPSAGSAVTARISYGRSDATGRNAIHNAGVPDARLSR